MNGQRLIGIMGGMVLLASSGLAWGGELPRAMTYSGRAVINSAQAAATGVVASGQLVSGVVASPLLISGAVGQVSSQVGSDLWGAAVSPIGTPLAVTEEHLTVGPPPDAALNANAARPALESE